MPSSSGTRATTASTRGMGRPSARPTSRIAARAASVPNVPICATFATPYFSLTYWITSPRRCWQKSMSMSGASRRLSSRNRSNKQIVVQRADVAQTQHVGNQRAHARAAGRGRNPLLARQIARSPRRSGSSWRNPACRSRPARARAAAVTSAEKPSVVGGDSCRRSVSSATSDRRLESPPTKSRSTVGR